MASSGKLRRVALVRTDVSEELSASMIRVTRIGELVSRNWCRCHLNVVTNIIMSGDNSFYYMSALKISSDVFARWYFKHSIIIIIVYYEHK
jgi:hypothetical protein